MTCRADVCRREALTPRRSYLLSLVVLIPMKVLFRFTPFLVAFSLAPPAAEAPGGSRFGEGYFSALAEQLGGRWLGISYFVGAQIAFVSSVGHQTAVVDEPLLC